MYLCRSFGLPEVAEYWHQVIVMNDWQKTRFAKNMVSSMFNTVSRQEDRHPGLRIQEGHGRHARDAGDRRVQIAAAGEGGALDL